MDSVEKLKSEEYEAQLFGFTSSDVTDGSMNRDKK